jgi:hypothetical protein
MLNYRLEKSHTVFKLRYTIQDTTNARTAHMAATVAVATPGSTTWAERNPTKDTLPIRHHARITAAARATKKLGAQQTRQKHELLAQAINQYLLEKQDKLQKLADEHDVKLAHIEKLVEGGTHYKKNRAPTLPNAIAHHKSLEVNNGMLAVS